MLRTFRSNPGIGGFAELGNEDIFPQVCKELVDNAFDSCRENQMKEVRRVRVTIEQEEFNVDPVQKGDSSLKQHVLRITVTDNGCGMEDIEKCVCPFESKKTSPNTREMAGRYGIGLTLCMLHAQRLVPNSHTTIKSAIASSSTWTSVKCVVDTDQDIVNIVDKKFLPKDVGKSGTAICIVVPGGSRAKIAWPRLAEYFARFHLSIGIQCSLEVLAPSFSNIPLFIRPAIEFDRMKDRKVAGVSQSPDAVNFLSVISDGSIKNDFLDVNKASVIEFETVHVNLNSNSSREIGDNNIDIESIFPDAGRNHSKLKSFQEQGHHRDEGIRRRQQIRNAFSSYLKREIFLCDVAHSSQRIRRDVNPDSSRNDSLAILEVDMVVCGRMEDDSECTSISDLNEDQNNQIDAISDGNRNQDFSKAKVTLIRMVNRIPLLDSAEASACGLVQGLLRRQLWHSVGLEISSLIHDESLCHNEKSLHTPIYSLSDNSLVLPFLVGHKAHVRYESERNNCNLCGDIDSENDCVHRVNKKRKKRQVSLQPVGIRMANVYIVAQIVADPSQLPLPTLCKGRLPMNDDAIDMSLQAGVLECLRSLQKTNPSLILTPNQLKRTELHAMYIPAFAQGIASMIANSHDKSLVQRLLEMIRFGSDTENSIPSLDGTNNFCCRSANTIRDHVSFDFAYEASLSDDIESRIRKNFAAREDEKKRHRLHEEKYDKKKHGACDINMVLFPAYEELCDDLDHASNTDNNNRKTMNG